LRKAGDTILDRSQRPEADVTFESRDIAAKRFEVTGRIGGNSFVTDLPISSSSSANTCVGASGRLLPLV